MYQISRDELSQICGGRISVTRNTQRGPINFETDKQWKDDAIFGNDGSKAYPDSDGWILWFKTDGSWFVTNPDFEIMQDSREPVPIKTNDAGGGFGGTGAIERVVGGIGGGRDVVGIGGGGGGVRDHGEEDRTVIFC